MSTKDFRQKYTVTEIMAAGYFDEKCRHEMIRESEDGELLVCANQGHTLKGVDETQLLEEIGDPLDAGTDGLAVHSTFWVHWPFIRAQGLSKAQRNHVHFAVGKDLLRIKLTSYLS